MLMWVILPDLQLEDTRSCWRYISAVCTRGIRRERLQVYLCTAPREAVLAVLVGLEEREDRLKEGLKSAVGGIGLMRVEE